MNLDRLYNIAESEHIQIYDWQIEDCNGIYLNYDKINAIGLNYDEFGTYIDEKCTLAEELGHYYCDATYSLYSDSTTISKKEYRANKWKCLVCVTKQALLDCYSKGLTNEFEIAEELEVEPDMVNFAYNYYFVN